MSSTSCRRRRLPLHTFDVLHGGAGPRALACVAGVSCVRARRRLLVSLHEARGAAAGVSAARATAVLPRVQIVGGALWAIRACHRFAESRA